MRQVPSGQETKHYPMLLACCHCKVTFKSSGHSTWPRVVQVDARAWSHTRHGKVLVDKLKMNATRQLTDESKVAPCRLKHQQESMDQIIRWSFSVQLNHSSTDNNSKFLWNGCPLCVYSSRQESFHSCRFEMLQKELVIEEELVYRSVSCQWFGDEALCDDLRRMLLALIGSRYTHRRLC